MKILILILLLGFISCSKEPIEEHDLWDLATSGPLEAGEDILVKKSEVVLKGDSSNIGPETEFQWTQVYGPKALIENPHHLVTKVSALSAGKYVFILSRTDGSERLSDTVSITVTM